MKIRDLFEDTNKHVTFCFGRFNPPTLGHKKLFDTMKKEGGEMKIFTSQSQDKKKNPLSYEQKIDYLRKLFPQYNGNIIEDRNLNVIHKVAAYLYDNGYRHATFVAGSDRFDAMKKILKDYNGVEGPHGMYDFDTLDFKNSGEREDGAEGVEGISGTKAREAAVTGNVKDFTKYTGAGEHAEDMYNDVRKALGISDEKAETDKT